MHRLFHGAGSECDGGRSPPGPVQRHGAKRESDAGCRAKSIDGRAIHFDGFEHVAAGLTASREPAHRAGSEIVATERLREAQRFDGHALE